MKIKQGDVVWVKAIVKEIKGDMAMVTPLGEGALEGEDYPNILYFVEDIKIATTRICCLTVSSE
jgi:hypothetical protein